MPTVLDTRSLDNPNFCPLTFSVESHRGGRGYLVLRDESNGTAALVAVEDAGAMVKALHAAAGGASSKVGTRFAVSPVAGGARIADLCYPRQGVTVGTEAMLGVVVALADGTAMLRRHYLPEAEELASAPGPRL